MSSRKNKVCKKCRADFHACSSCGLYYDWEYDYCSRGCYVSSDEIAAAKWATSAIARRFTDDEEGRELLFRLIEERAEEKLDLLQDALKAIAVAECPA